MLQGVGGVRRALQAAAHQVGRDAVRRGKGPRQPQAARRRRTLAEHNMQVNTRGER